MNPVMPYQHFKKAIIEKLIDDQVFDFDWFKTQEKRLNMFWLNNETPDSAYDVIGAIAEAKFSGKSFSFPSIESLKAIGCEF